MGVKVSKFCPNCGEELADDANFCKNCGKDLSKYQKVFNDSNHNVSQYSEKSHTVATVLGFVFAVLIPIIGIFFGIYLITRDDSDSAKRYGKIIIAVAVIVWVINFIFFF